ncbi:MAG TPA: 50S ribosomal protein L23 [Candidatus Fimivicinus intestinavium]|nr:50S ribosomal protein L23 [Candidatus Fimivicinus intestinavium]
MSKLAQDIVLRPVITEESMQGIALRKYTFKVAKDANKVEIAKAVEKLFGVEVEKVNTISVRGRLRRQGRFEGRTASWKKAIVTLTEKSKKIDFFDGMM